MAIDTPSPSRRNDTASVGEVVEFVKTYAKQETVGPIRNAGRFVMWGSVGAVALGLGLSLILLGVLRLVQTEWTSVSSADSGWNWVPYFIVLVACGLAIALTVRQIPKKFLDKDDK